MLLSQLLFFALLEPPVQPVLTPELEPPTVSRPRIGVLSIAGVTSAGAGLGALVAGAVLLERAHHPPVDHYYLAKPRRHGAALVSVGVVGMSMGLSLLALELGVFGRQPATKHLSLGVELGPTSGGLWLRGSF